ncbi:MAG: choice-of-anchor B family protein [Planctomycetota bacterium]|nr:choice-of-anchor B family protein [Planctomycetota bacterium]
MTSGPMNSGCVLAGWAWVAMLTAMPASAGFPAKNVSLYAHLSVQDFKAEFAEDCWGYVSPSGREYAIIGLSTGTGFVEITDPTNPAIIDVVLTPNQGRDMKVSGHYVYSSSDAGPFHIIDVQEIDNGVVTLVNTIEGGTHNIAINEQSGFLYASVGGPLVVLSLADSVNPELVAIREGQAHDAQVVTYTEGRYAGREIAFVFAGWSQQIDIVDVTDKSDMFLVGSTTYPNAAYTHQGWLSGDRRYLYVSDELDDIQRTSILDVSDLSNPFPVGEFTTGLPSTDHNLYVRDGFVFEANYTSGLRVFNACDPVNPVEVGFFDTFPANDDPGFSGAWSSYPFFPSGTVIVSDRSGGLFILDVSAAIGSGCSLGDLDGDGTVGIIDLLILLSEWGPCPDPPDECPADLDGDGAVGILDLLTLLANWS